MANKITKPETERQQIDAIWDFLFNRLQHKVSFLDMKINFMLAFIALILALLGIVIFK